MINLARKVFIDIKYYFSKSDTKPRRSKLTWIHEQKTLCDQGEHKNLLTFGTSLNKLTCPNNMAY